MLQSTLPHCRLLRRHLSAASASGALRRVFLGLSLITVTNSAAAVEMAEDEYTKTVATLRAACAADDPIQQAECRGFIDGMGQYRHLFAKGFKITCTPVVDIEAVRVAFLAWADQHEEYGNATAFSGVLEVMKMTWPCGKEAAP